ncbi:MAG: fatty acid-binding protein DegV [Anaerolineaceae bacterium]|nr:DegV family protein [Chloroflexota bacterium]WKZ55102.1 MAG: DegV family protein [Anaerolineales bacterium]GJQ37968.1 MAG: fatty acid-binding protein DegV [Anaerolineaceae bacterium]NOG75673.1 DegV family protein [Chloroflexota bacterium]GIK10843.1 MAG: fatty acid-binding protein DegV [Chloroflexota bacterium]
MSKTALVTDSTAWIPKDLLAQYNITVAPQVLIWGEETLNDGIDIQPTEFYSRIKTAKVMPTTSQVSIVTMQNIFNDLLEKGFDVLGIFISSKLSGTIQSATQAREALNSGKDKIHIVDSYSTAMAMGFHVLAAARAIEKGASLAEAISVAEKARDHTGVYFAVETLEFLHRGGRIGGAQRFIGAALNMKPVLALVDGRVEAIERIRTKSKAVERVFELVAEKTRGKTPLHLASLHANAPEEARALLERARKELNAEEAVFTEVSPVVGNHAGPGVVGLAYMAGM